MYFKAVGLFLAAVLLNTLCSTQPASLLDILGFGGGLIAETSKCIDLYVVLSSVTARDKKGPELVLMKRVQFCRFDELIQKKKKNYHENKYHSCFTVNRTHQASADAMKMLHDDLEKMGIQNISELESPFNQSHSSVRHQPFLPPTLNDVSDRH